MSKRPNQFKRFKPPKKVSADEESTEKKEDTATASNSTNPPPADRPVQPIPIKPPPSSESEQDTPGSSHLAKPATGNLLVSHYSNFDLINSHLNNIYPYVRRRAQVILNHDAIAEALNSCSQPPNTIRISDQLPRPPHRVSFSDDFVKRREEKRRLASIPVGYHVASQLSISASQNNYKQILTDWSKQQRLHSS